jgi:hypothetical protein
MPLNGPSMHFCRRMAATNIVEIYAGGWRVNGYYAHTPSWLKAEQGADETILGNNGGLCAGLGEFCPLSITS